MVEKGQLGSALMRWRNWDLKIHLLGIVARRNLLPWDPVPLYIVKLHETLKLIQQMRTEAHRLELLIIEMKIEGNDRFRT